MGIRAQLAAVRLLGISVCAQCLRHVNGSGMNCIDCQNLTSGTPLQASGGWGKCSVQNDKFVMVQWQRECEKFARALDAVIAKRMDWMSKNPFMPVVARGRK
jgi:hypothetical protein